MKLVKRSHRVPVPAPAKKCQILAAPAEIRLAIYHYIAPRGFLPYAPYRDYMGLFLSCKQINDEMKHEALRVAPGILRAIQEHDPNTAMKIRPLRPVEFGAVMHVTVGFPRWALFNDDALEYMFRLLLPLLGLHLSSLTIGIEDMETDWDLYQLISGLRRSEFLRYMQAYDNTPAVSGGPAEKAKFYSILTTYADIVGFATAINCLVAPQLCAGEHHIENSWCIRRYSTSPLPSIECKVRKIVLRLKNLDEEVPCESCGKLPHDVYALGSIRMRWSPTDELRKLRRNDWYSIWTDEHGKRRLFSKRHPAQFIWARLAEKKAGGAIKGLKRLLKRF